MNTREQLIEQLKEYKGLLNKEIIDYLNGIINLDYSAVRDDIIDMKIKEHLNELEIYKKAATYNIYYRTKKMIEEYDKEQLLLFMDCIEYDYCSAIVKNNGKQPVKNLFDFYYNQNSMVENDDFGYISLVRYPNIEDELDIASRKIDVINYEKNRFDKTSSSNEKYERKARYDNLKKYYNYLKEIKYDQKSLYKYEYANECINMIYNDYDLISPKCLFIKKPGLTINQHIGKL